jgi:hypothetical protein
MRKIGYWHKRYLMSLMMFERIPTEFFRENDRGVTIILCFEVAEGLKIYQYLAGNIVAKAFLLL